jgi:methylated-DNA-[protein]-cysteine S-methyltransferase
MEIPGENNMTTYYTYLDNPFQTLLLTSDGRMLTGLFLVEQNKGQQVGAERSIDGALPSGRRSNLQAFRHSGSIQIGADWVRHDESAPFMEAKRQLTAYFHGELKAFDLPLRLCGTEFQQRVWEELRRIPYGSTISYGELAQRVGNPNASRAVGLANGRNPISIVVPCHRVIGANGKLTGYSGGVARKEALLALEASVLTGKPDLLREEANRRI